MHVEQATDFGAEQLPSSSRLLMLVSSRAKPASELFCAALRWASSACSRTRAGELAARNRHSEQHQHRQDVPGILNGESVGRRNEEEIIGE